MSRRLARGLALATGASMGAVLATGAGVGYYVARVLTAPRRPSPMDGYVMTPFETGVPWEDVRIPTEREDRTLDGWWFPRPETDQVVIGLTGFRGAKSELIGIGSALWRAGFNVLLFDYHGHGAGHGAPVTLAYRELRDVYAALDYTLARISSARVGVIGFSMGAALAILSAAGRPEIRAVVADSPFATHADVVSHNIARTIRLPGEPFLLSADYFLARRAGYRSRDVAPLRVVDLIAPRPLFLIHGTADQTIPASHTQRLYDAASGPKELWLADGAGHCGAYFLDRPSYCQRVSAFFACALEREEPVEQPAPVGRDGLGLGALG
ncbi:MAG TPA: alpha/beta fold hydrolase [Ktedonobacterales bacterium]|nr:alpha/beta fold hydrolase [Ktedonobacterales bacterium]